MKGNLKQFFSRVNGVHKKNGPFEVSALVCLHIKGGISKLTS